jgi:hypothetical protein
MLEEEAVDRIVRRSFDLSVQVLLVPVLRRECTEIVVVAREAVPDAGADAERSPLVDGELASLTDSAAAHDGSMGSGLLGDSLLEFVVYRSESEEAHDGVFQLESVTIFLTLAGLSSDCTLGRPSSGRLIGACLSSSVT